jgi:hypothetical protein
MSTTLTVCPAPEVKLAWARRAKAAYRAGEHPTGVWFSCAAALPRAGVMPATEYARLNDRYCRWVCRGFIPQVARHD